ncbi:MAG: gas vesicle protein GvpH [Dehalococcoidales bacterium]|nr:gas vesicle protein GvpH [Dehalococcoidales bacterium]
MENKRIKGLRLELGLSQERFARLLGVSLQTVRRWEEGLTRPLPIISLKLEELQRKIGGAAMAERKRKPERGVEFDFGLGGLFKGIGNLLDLVSAMAEEGKEEYTRTGEIKGLGGKAKGVYGFSVKMGLGGKPVIEQFGNIKATEKGAVVAEVREPMVDVFDEEERLVVIAELPGVEESDIHLEVRDDILDLTAEARDRKYSKEVLLPSAVDIRSMETSYKNGILEIKLRKK